MEFKRKKGNKELEKIWDFLGIPNGIEAIQWIGINGAEICEFIRCPENGHIIKQKSPEYIDGLIIHTKLGEMRVTPGDWVAKYLDGSHYPWAYTDIVFAQTYEVA